MRDPIPELQRLLGKKTVFIRWPKGVKGGKRKWKHLRLADMTPDYLATLKEGNIGVALGEVSGGLCVIDCDTDEFAEQLLEANPLLAKTLRTHGARGCAFWFRPKGEYPKRSTKLKDQAGNPLGEFRSNGCQSIVWGTHPETKQWYRMVVKKPVMLVDFATIKWPTDIQNPPTMQNDREGRDSDVISADSVPLSLCLSVGTIQQAVEISLPTAPHQNNACLFRLSRALKAIESREGPLTNEQKLWAFSKWYDLAHARGVLRIGQSRDEYLGEFFRAYNGAKTPLGDGPAEQAMARAKKEPLPPEATVFESKKGKLLVGLCYQLQQMTPGKPWFLSARMAGDQVGVPWQTAAKWLATLIALEILKMAEKYTSVRATRYLYRDSGASQS